MAQSRLVAWRGWSLTENRGRHRPPQYVIECDRVVFNQDQHGRPLHVLEPMRARTRRVQNNVLCVLDTNRDVIASDGRISCVVWNWPLVLLRVQNSSGLILLRVGLANERDRRANYHSNQYSSSYSSCHELIVLCVSLPAWHLWQELAKISESHKA